MRFGLCNSRLRRSGRRTRRTGWALASAGVLAAVGLLAAPAAQATGVPPSDPHTYYIGDDGALWGYEGLGDGTFTRPAQLGPAKTAEPGARLAAVRLKGYPLSVFFVGLDGAVYQDCPTAQQPFPITSTGVAPSGAAITAFDTGRGPGVVVSGIPPRQEAERAANPALTREISNPCTPPPRLMLNNGSSSYTGSDLASAGGDEPYQGVFFVDGKGSVRAQWYSAATSMPVSVTLTQPGTAAPAGGVAVTSDGAGALTLFFTGLDGRLYAAHPKQGGGLSGPPQPNPNGPADVPGGAHLAAATGPDGIAVGYAAGDGTFTVATLSTDGTWKDTAPFSDPGFLVAGASVGVTAADDGWDWYCGNDLRFLWHFHGPGPRPGWFQVGDLANAVLGTFFAAA